MDKTETIEVVMDLNIHFTDESQKVAHITLQHLSHLSYPALVLSKH